MARFRLLQWSTADDIEVVKSVATEDGEKRNEESDQVALESEQQEQHVHPPPHIVQGLWREILFAFIDFTSISFLF